MANPPSQVLAMWALEEAGPGWEELPIVLARAAAAQLHRPQAEIEDMLEANERHVEKHLRDDIRRNEEDGTICPFELDDNVPPYIKSSPLLVPQHLKQLRILSPASFVRLCVAMLDKMGGKSEANDSAHDGGVDFVGFDMRFAADVSIPAKCLMAVVGQAKHQNGCITESDLRKFVGGATRRIHDYRVAGRIAISSPVVLAFWTTSEFHEDASAYARSLGIWLLNGRSIAKFAAEQGLLPASPVARGK